MSDVHTESDRVLLDRLAEEFAERHRRGESPSVSEYAERHPELADQIRDLFPALLAMERLKPTADLTAVFGEDATQVTGRRPRYLGEYRLLREVGRGGMGVVYEAVQESLGRHVALKVFPGGALGGPTHLERFRREARAAGRLHHTNIVPVFGTGECDGVHFYAMQFIPGQALDNVLSDLRRLRDGRGSQSTPGTRSDPSASAAWALYTGEFPGGEAAAGPQKADSGTEAVPPEKSTASSPSLSCSGLSSVSEGAYYRSVARVGLQVAEALAYAHRQGVLHRDVKPSNLLLDTQGTVWVTDFGLAKADDAEGLTGTGDIVGTLRYMAPERFDGKSLPQGDVYSLGLTLYELLTLRVAFEDSNRGRLIEKVLHEAPPPPRQADRRIPPDLETVVLKCVAKDARERYPSASALAEALRRFLADRPVLARRASWRERFGRWCRRNPAVAGLTAAVALLLVAVAVGSLVVAVHLRKQRDEAVESERLAEANAQRALAAEERASHYFKLLEEHRTTLPDPGVLLAFRGQVGRTYRFRAKGNTDGRVWGTDVYTDDSFLATAAVHAGALLPDEVGVVKVTILPGQESYSGSSRNSIFSSGYGPWTGSFRVEPEDGKRRAVWSPPHPVRPPPFGSPTPTDVSGQIRGKNGEVFHFEVTGARDGTVWGSDVYTDDSDLATAAVHAGLLQVGQKGIVKVTLLPGQQQYRGSTRNGVTTLDYHAWDGSYRIEAVPLPDKGPGRSEN